MASDLVFDSYKRYKSGTSRFLSWLVEAAGRCGESVEKSKRVTSAPSDAKTKTPEAHDSEEYEIPVGHFIRLAKSLAEPATPRAAFLVPRLYYNLLVEVIALRKEAAVILGQRVHKSDCDHGYGDQESDGHGYFIYVLEQVKAILLPLVEKAPPTTTKTDAADHAKNLANIFEALDVEDPVEIHSNDSPYTPQNEPAQSAKRIPQKTYSIKPAQDDLLISSLFFFRDTNHIRKVVRRMWTAFREGRQDLITVTLVTNTAIELIQQNLKQHFEMVAEWGDVRAPEPSDWYDYICSSVMTSQDPKECAMNYAESKEEEYVGVSTALHIIKFFEKLVPGIIISFEADVEISDQRPSHKKSFAENLQHNRDFIFYFLGTLHNASVLHNTQDIGCHIPSNLDPITRAFWVDGITETRKHKDFPVWLTFALQILMDIHYELEQDTSKAFEQLQATGERVVGMTQSYFRYSRSMGSKLDSWHEHNDSQLLTIIRFISIWIRKDHIADRVSALRTRIGFPEDSDKTPSKGWGNGYHLLNVNPLLCGSIMYFLEWNMQRIFVGFSNLYGSILAAAHLYNAAKQSNYLGTWTDMEYLISNHTDQRFFVGERPSNTGDYWKRFQMALGVSAVTFSRNKRKPGLFKSEKNQRDKNLRARSPIHAIFRSVYLKSEPNSDLTDKTIGAVISDVVRRFPQHSLVVQYAKIWKKERRLSSVQLLVILGEALSEQSIHLRFDYLSMEIRCANLLRSIRSKLLADAVEMNDASRVMISNLEESESLGETQADNTLAKFLEKEIPDNVLLAISLTLSIFLAILDSAEEIPTIRIVLLRRAGVSLQKTGQIMKEVIEKDGRIELSKAEAFHQSEVMGFGNIEFAPLLTDESDDVGDGLSMVLRNSKCVAYGSYGDYFPDDGEDILGESEPKDDVSTDNIPEEDITKEDTPQEDIIEEDTP